MRNRVPLLGVLVVLLLGVAFWFLLYQPRNDDLEAVRQETATLETQRSSLQNEIARLREVEANQVEIRAALARLEEFIPSGPAQSTVVRQFQLAADASGVEISSVVFSTPSLVEEAPPTGTPGTSLARIPLTMNLEGGYFQIVDFLRRLEVEIPRAVLVGDFQAAEGEDGFPSLSGTWIGDLFAVVPTESVDEAPPPPDPDTTDEAADENADADVDVDVEDETNEDATT